MSIPTLTITPAGFEALADAELPGTKRVKIAQVGLSSVSFDVDAVGAALPGQIKRLTAVAGKAVAKDTLHISVRDDTQDTYTLRGFGLFLDDGTLFAVYSQATPIMEKAAAATLLLATDARFTKVDATHIEVGPIGFINPPASQTDPGVVRLASRAEAVGGVDKHVAMTPSNVSDYVDNRFGEGAPSNFFKGVMTAATAALLRVAIGIKSAALKDEGTGNGLDADLLDGVHGAHYLEWANFKNVPTAFNPAPHPHPITQIDGLLDALNNVNAVKLGGKSPAYYLAWENITGAPGAFPPVAHTHTMDQVHGLQMALQNVDATRLGGKLPAYYLAWENITGTPAAFPPVAHAHTMDQVDGLQLAMTNVDAVKLGSKSPAYYLAWDNITGKPVAFPPVAHPHTMDQVDGLQLALQGRALLTGADFSGSVSVAGTLIASNAISSRSNGFSTSGSGNGYWFADRSNPSSEWAWYCDAGATRLFNSTNSDLLTVSSSGALWTLGGFDFGSSRRLKDIEGPMPYGLEEVRRISTLIGRYKPAYNNDGRRRLFFDAEQFMTVMPEAIDAEGVEFEGEHVPTIKIDQVMPPAYRAIGELADMMDTLMSRVERLERGR